MKKLPVIFIIVSSIVCCSLTVNAAQSLLDISLIHKTAVDSRSMFLNEAERIRAVVTFVKLVRIEGPSGKEQEIQNELRSILTGAGGSVILTDSNNPQAPCNLVMEIPGTGDLADKPGILLNAHVDTIARSTPEFMVLDANTGDFYHLYETDSGKSSSFGGDDRSAVTVIVEAARKLQADYWAKGIQHRRILLVFTADEERGCVGAKYLSEHRPDLFDDLQISLTMDGPLDYMVDYPRNSFIAVVSEGDSGIMPYKHVTELMKEFCERSGTRFARTQAGLGMGDFASFPAKACTGLHLRSPVRGFHNKERLKVQDLINHIDLLCYILLGWDNPVPTGISEVGK
jgi:putative aminopeptidase FrvX